MSAWLGSAPARRHSSRSSSGRTDSNAARVYRWISASQIAAVSVRFDATAGSGFTSVGRNHPSKYSATRLSLAVRRDELAHPPNQLRAASNFSRWGRMSSTS